MTPWFDAVDWCATDYQNRPRPVPTGIPKLDHVLIGGLKPGVYTVLGRPGEGKSALAIFMAESVATSGSGAAVISLEMPDHDAWLRAASSYSVRRNGENGCRMFSWSAVDYEADATARYGGSNLSSGGDAIITAARLMSSLPLLIAAPPEPSIGTVVSLLAEAKDVGAQMAVVDYLQLIDVPGIDREYERVSTAMRSLVGSSLELKLPIVLLAAMNRGGLTGGASMHSASGSSVIEYASTCVMTYVRDKDAESADGTRAMLLNVEKNRSGMVTDEPIRLKYWPAYNWIEETE